MRFPSAAVLFVLSIIAISAVLLVASSAGISWHLLPQISLFMLLIIVASFLIVPDPAGGVVSSAVTLFYVAIYIFNPITAFFVVALGYAIGNTLPRDWVTWRVFFNAAQMGLSTFLGALVFRALGGDIATSGPGSLILPGFLGPLTHQVANNFFVAFLISRVRGLPFLRTWVSFIREFLWSNLLSMPTAMLIALLYTRVHHAFILFFLVSLPFQRWAIRLYLEERGTYAKIIESLVRAAELSLPGTRGHARRVADLSLALGRELGLADRDNDLVEYAALLHDVGMIGYDDLLTSGAAYSDIRGLIEKHVRVGAEIVSELPRPEIAEIVRNHHNGLANPVTRGRRRSIVSLGSRIVALAEEVDSRVYGLFPYKESEPPSLVVQFVTENRGVLFDHQVVDAFVSVLKKQDTSLKKQDTSAKVDQNVERSVGFGGEGVARHEA